MAPSPRFPGAKIFALLIFLLFCCVLGLGGWILAGSLVQPPDPTPQIISAFSTALAAIPATSLPLIETPLPAVTPMPAPTGKIVYVCQLFSLQAQDQICLMNADGSGQRRITTNDQSRNFYPSLSPDGQSVVFSSNLDGNFKIYEFVLATGQLMKLGDVVGIAPEISPDNRQIVYVRNDGTDTETIWLMNRDGTNYHKVYGNGWDPTWSPDSAHLLFATMVGSVAQLATINLDGSGFRQLTNLSDFRGRSDWSASGEQIVTYAGKPWARELFLLDADGSNLHQIGVPGGDSQGPSFSPDGQWVTFTAYFDHPRQSNGCEIYVMRIDGSELMRLTDNKYCDWQPRWGP